MTLEKAFVTTKSEASFDRPQPTSSVKHTSIKEKKKAQKIPPQNPNQIKH